MDQHSEFGVGYILGRESGSDVEPDARWSIEKQISDPDQFAELQEAARSNLALVDRLHLAALEKSYSRLILMNSYYSKVFSAGASEAPFELRQAGFWWGVELQGWLDSFYSYLEHYKKQMKKELGKESAEFETFEDARKSAYAASDSYQFVYELRNYTIHRGFPVTHVNQSLIEGVPGRQGSLKTEFMLSRSLLLADYEWEKVDSLVRRLPEEIHIFPHVESVMTSMRQLFQVIVGLRARRAWSKLAVLEESI
ncbi:MAG TPA: hypothetical protein VE196_12975, partial [Pseudonocardiaceae bacterium]|nr:hypothetical protein [Pseudonocardiaceae bacterium]